MEPPARVGRYAIRGEVARGGTGVVYRGTSADGQLVAVKLLLAGKDADPLQRRRVATEVRSLLRLRHPNLVSLLDAGEHQGVPYVVMEWVTGETLGQRIERQGPLEPAEAVELVRRLCQAIAHCHGLGVLHRDLKPDNVLLRARDGQPLLTDFGLSKDLASGQQTTAVRTVQGRWLGTPGYWPPEQALGEIEEVDERADVFGLGAVLYATLTGSPPHEGRTVLELLDALDRPPVPPRLRRPAVPAWLDAVCLSALAKDPTKRPASALELERALAQGASLEPTSHPAQGPGAPRPGRATWMVNVLAALVLGIAAGVMLWLALDGSSAEPAERRPAPQDPGEAR